MEWSKASSISSNIENNICFSNRDQTSSDISWQMLDEMLGEMLGEMLDEMLGEMLGEMLDAFERGFMVACVTVHFENSRTL